MPDAALALTSYGVTLALIGMGPADRTQEHPWIALAQAAKVSVDAIAAVYLTVEQVSKHRALCFWCLVGAGASVAALPPSLPEARSALRRLLTR